MRSYHFVLLLVIYSTLALFASTTRADVNRHFDNIKNDPNALYAFLKAMPKGGELHYHLAGGAYPEEMIEFINSQYCLDTKTATVYNENEKVCLQKADAIKTEPSLYDNTVRAWSLKDFNATHESAHDHFFNAFYKFGTIVANYRPQLLAKVMQRATNQHEQYLEVMILPDNAKSTTYGTLIANTPTLVDKKNILLRNSSFQKNIANTVSEVSEIEKKTRSILKCDSQKPDPACKLTVKFQYIVLREQPLDQIFAQALNAFVATSQSNLIVGVNLVQAEDSIVSRKNYAQTMQVFQYLHKLYPDVHISLHAGELSPEAVPLEAMQNHIHDAIFTGHAERIGHGASIAYENNLPKTLEKMRTQPVAVEINLTSNEKLLNISNLQHPINFYLKHNIPIVLSTDDEGLLRTDLTREYLKAVMNHQLDYPTIKNISRNVISYSFLPGKSIWKTPAQAERITACKVLNSNTCLNFIANNPKAAVQWRLEKKLAKFEKQWQ